MATRVRLTADVDADLRREVKIAAAEDEQSVSEWIEQVLIDKLDRRRYESHTRSGRRYIAPEISLPPPGSKPRGSKTMAESVLEDSEAVYLPLPGEKPKGSKNPPRLKDGSRISDAVIEDRR